MFRLSIQEVDGSQLVELLVRMEISLDPAEPRPSQSGLHPKERRRLALVRTDPGQPVAMADTAAPGTSGPPEHEINPGGTP